MPKKTVVIGIGNTLRRDDGIGILILESLLKFYKRQELDYLDFATASFNLVGRLADYDKALLIDGINAGLAVGQMRILKIDDLDSSFDIALGSTHEFDLKSLFEIIKKLKIKTKLYLAGIQIEDTGYGEGLSIALEKKKESITREISEFIDKTFKLRI